MGARSEVVCGRRRVCTRNRTGGEGLAARLVVNLLSTYDISKIQECFCSLQQCNYDKIYTQIATILSMVGYPEK